MKVNTIAPQKENANFDGGLDEPGELYKKTKDFIDKDVSDIFVGAGFFPSFEQQISAQIAKNLREISIQLKELNIKIKG